MEAWLDHGAHDAAVATLVLSVVVPVASGQSSGMAVDGVEVIEIAQSGQSLASAISEGIALATGSYIAILGASDRLEPNVAAALSAALETGADAVYTDEHGGYEHMLAMHRGLAITPEQRLRFVTLLSAAADAAGLPADPEARAALMGYAEWGTRLAVENSAPDARPAPRAPVPRWGWGVAPPYQG